MTNVDLPSRVLSLCAGGGGLDLGLRLAVPGARTVVYLENEVTACGVLAARMEDGGLDDAPVWTDLRTFDFAAWRGVVDTVIGGYPCQPFSNAGKRLGADDPRHLWPAIAAGIRDLEPRWCFFENVGAHLRLGFRDVARDLQGMGYRVAAVLLTAEEVGAPHGRERLFILADRDQQHAHGLRHEWEGRRPEPSDSSLSMADSRRGAGRACAERGGEGSRSEEPGWAGERCEEVDDTASPRLVGREPGASGAVRDEARRGEPRGRRDALADPELRRVRDSAAGGEDRPGDAAGWTGEGMEHTAGERWGEGRPEPVVDGGRGSATSADSALGDSDLTRLEGWSESVFGGRYQLPAWPPGPEDDAGWRGVPPRYWPAAPQPGVRRVAYGVARWLDDDLARSDQLHILGNGVVPQQAARAFGFLWEALGCRMTAPSTRKEEGQ